MEILKFFTESASRLIHSECRHVDMPRAQSPMPCFYKSAFMKLKYHKSIPGPCQTRRHHSMIRDRSDHLQDMKWEDFSLVAWYLYILNVRKMQIFGNHQWKMFRPAWTLHHMLERSIICWKIDLVTTAN